MFLMISMTIYASFFCLRRKKEESETQEIAVGDEDIVYGDDPEGNDDNTDEDDRYSRGIIVCIGEEVVI